MHATTTHQLCVSADKLHHKDHCWLRSQVTNCDAVGRFAGSHCVHALNKRRSSLGASVGRSLTMGAAVMSHPVPISQSRIPKDQMSARGMEHMTA